MKTIPDLSARLAEAEVSAMRTVKNEWQGQVDGRRTFDYVLIALALAKVLVQPSSSSSLWTLNSLVNSLVKQQNQVNQSSEHTHLENILCLPWCALTPI